MTPAERLVTALGGKAGMARCPVHDDRSPSLSVRDGERGPLVTCHAGCDRAAVIAELKRRGLWGEAEPRTEKPPPSRDKRAAALEIWRTARRDLPPYFRARGITIPLPPTLRYHPHLMHAPTGLHLPAIVAAVQAPDRSIIAIQRTFLVADGSRKAPVSSPKMTLGRLGTGAVRLGPAGAVLGIAEGIETGLAAMQLFGGAVWCALGASRLDAIALPPDVRHVVIYGDCGEAGETAARKAGEAYARQGRRVTGRFPPAGDWNDELQRRARAEAA